MRSKASLPPAGQLQRGVELAALEQGLEDAEGRGPGAHADAGAGLGQRLGDGEAEAAVVGDAGDERPFAPQVDVHHGGRSFTTDGAPAKTGRADVDPARRDGPGGLAWEKSQ